MARNPTQKARRLRLEAAAEEAKAHWHALRSKAAGKRGASRKLAEAEAYEAEAIYRKLARRLKPRKREESVVESIMKDLGI